MSADISSYAKLFGNIGFTKDTQDSIAMAKCACVACNSCTCACSCHNIEGDEIEW